MKQTRFLALLLGAVALVHSGVAAASDAPRARLRDFVCQPAPSPLQRAISVTAVMRPVTGTQRMALRFVLLSKAPGARSFAPVHSGDLLGSWLSPKGQPTLGSQPGDVWRVTAPVAVLSAPASYEYRVSFRWTGAHGQVLWLRTLRSATCFQPELRPDLLVQAILVDPTTLNSYEVEIRNAGATAAGHFSVAFVPGAGGLPTTRSVAGLSAHGTLYEVFPGPKCTAATAPTVTVDPNQEVADVTRANNSLTAICPPAAGP